MKISHNDYETLEEHFQAVEDAKASIFDEWEAGDLSTAQARDRARELNPSYEKLMADFNAWM